MKLQHEVVPRLSLLSLSPHLSLPLSLSLSPHLSLSLSLSCSLFHAHSLFLALPSSLALSLSLSLSQDLLKYRLGEIGKKVNTADAFKRYWPGLRRV